MPYRSFGHRSEANKEIAFSFLDPLRTSNGKQSIYSAINESDSQTRYFIFTHALLLRSLPSSSLLTLQMDSSPSYRHLCISFLLAMVLLLGPVSVSSEQKVTVSLYYESLCPYCANFIVNSLVKLFEKGLISIVDLRLVPWGNSWIQSDGSFGCQVKDIDIDLLCNIHSVVLPRDIMSTLHH